jgi:ABC-2 type transport system ATP-binding protein
VVADGACLPPSPPQSWLVPEINGHSLRVVESEYQQGLSESRLAGAVPGAGEVSASEMSLREIFLALARTFRLKA